MTFFQLQIGHKDYDYGYVVDAVHNYATKEEADKALAWWKTLPEDPYAMCRKEASVVEVEIHETFEPWFTDEQVQRMRAELDEVLHYYDMEDQIHAQNEAIYERMLDETEPDWRDE
jgi:hypothetical protein